MPLQGVRAGWPGSKLCLSEAKRLVEQIARLCQLPIRKR